MLIKEGKTYLYGVGILLLIILGVVVVLLRQTNYSIGLMVDSLTHTSTAESLLRGEGFITAWNSRPQQGQPPLYALALTLTATLNVSDRSIFEYAGYMGAVIFGLIVLVSMVWVFLRSKSLALTTIAGSVLATSTYLGDLYSFALTVTLFLLFAVSAFVFLDRFVDSGQRSMLIWAAVFSALAWLTRHIGITVVISSLLVLVVKGGSTFQRKANSIATYSIISMLPPSLWMLRNYVVLGQPTERYWSTVFDWGDTVDLASSEFTKWLIGATGLNILDRSSSRFGIDNAMGRVSFLGLTVILCVVGLVYLSYKGSIRLKIGGLIVPILFLSCYSGALLTSLILTNVAFETRYLGPIYITAVVAIFILLGQCLTHTSQTTQPVGSTSCQQADAKSRLQNIMIVGLALHLVLAVFSNYDQIKLWRERGFGYSSKAWIDSETIRYLKSNPIHGKIYSNEARAAYIYRGGSDETETHFVQLQSELPDEARYWDDMARDENLEMHIVWFHGWRPFIQTQYDLVQLISLYDLEVVAVLEDGIVLRSSNSFDVSRHDVGSESERAENLIIEAILNGAQLIAHSEFDIYLADARLVYISACSDANTEHPFFLHIFPTSVTDDILNHNVGFNNHDFRFSREGFSFGERCAVIRILPSYDIELIRTGQFTADGVELWEESFSPQVSSRGAAP